MSKQIKTADNSVLTTICIGCEWNTVFEISARMGTRCPHMGRPSCHMNVGVVWVTIQVPTRIEVHSGTN